MPALLRPDFNGVPMALRALPQWVLWREELRGNKPTKVPYHWEGEHHASTTDARSWGSFNEVYEAYYRGNEHWDGCGFVVQQANDLLLFDLDACRNIETGALAGWADFWVTEFDSYTEISPSGTGIHIIAKGRFPFSGRRRGSKEHPPCFEAYADARFFCITGLVQAQCSDDIYERQDAIDLLALEFDEVITVEPRSYEPPGAEMQTALRFQLMQESDRLFNLTWERRRTDLGDQSDSGYEMSLVVQAALCGWGRADLVWLIKHHRVEKCADPSKGDRQDYLDRTIDRALGWIRQRLTPTVDLRGTQVAPPPQSSPTAAVSPPRPAANGHDPEPIATPDVPIATAAAPGEGESESIDAPAAAGSHTNGVDPTPQKIDDLSEFLTVWVFGLVQSNDPPIFYLRVSKPNGPIIDVRIGSERDLDNQNLVRAKLGPVSERMFPLMRRAGWLALVQRLLECRIYRNIDRSTLDRYRELLRGWIRPQRIAGQEERFQAIDQRMPFWELDAADVVWINAEKFRQHLNLSLDIKLDSHETEEVFSQIAGPPKKRLAIHGGRRTSNVFYPIPVALFDGEIELPTRRDRSRRRPRVDEEVEEVPY
jgi:hypothetical protein